jgi:hypothetical protein
LSVVAINKLLLSELGNLSLKEKWEQAKNVNFEDKL